MLEINSWAYPGIKQGRVETLLGTSFMYKKNKLVITRRFGESCMYGETLKKTGQKETEGFSQEIMFELSAVNIRSDITS